MMDPIIVIPDKRVRLGGRVRSGIQNNRFTNWIPAFAGMTTTLFLITILPTPLKGEFLVGPGATGSSFLKIPIAARPAAMGSAFTAVSGDAASMEYNPAGLCEIERSDLSATLINYIEESKIQSVTFGFPVDLKKGSNLGDGVFGPNSDKIFLGFQYRGFKAEDTARDALGVPLEDIESKDQVIQGSLGYSPFERWQFGVSGKMISSELADESMTNYAMDAGLIWKVNAQLQVGASILNLGPDKAFISEKDPLPTTLRTGLSFQARSILLTADLLTGRDKITQEAVGAEWSPVQLLKLRAGLLNDTEPEYSAGIGLFFSPNPSGLNSSEKLKRENRKVLEDLKVSSDNPLYEKYKPRSAPLDFCIDYALRSQSTLGIAHTVTLRILY